MRHRGFLQPQCCVLRPCEAPSHAKQHVACTGCHSPCCGVPRHAPQQPCCAGAGAHACMYPISGKGNACVRAHTSVGHWPCVCQSACSHAKNVRNPLAQSSMHCVQRLVGIRILWQDAALKCGDDPLSPCRTEIASTCIYANVCRIANSYSLQSSHVQVNVVGTCSVQLGWFRPSFFHYVLGVLWADRDRRAECRQGIGSAMRKTCGKPLILLRQPLQVALCRLEDKPLCSVGSACSPADASHAHDE